MEWKLLLISNLYSITRCSFDVLSTYCKLQNNNITKYVKILKILILLIIMYII